MLDIIPALAWNSFEAVSLSGSGIADPLGDCIEADDFGPARSSSHEITDQFDGFKLGIFND